MKVTKLKSSKIVSINTSKYLIDWKNDGNSSFERRFRDLIYPFWRNQIILFQLTIPGSLLKLDFLNVNKRLLVEIDGCQHNTFNKHFHRGSRAIFLASLRRDNDKELWCEKNNITVLRLNEEDIDNFSIDYIYDKFGINLV